MIFHVARDGQPLGTFTQEEIRDHLEAERLFVTDLVWSRGMEDWEALAQVFEVEMIMDEDGNMPKLPPGLPPRLPGAQDDPLPESWPSSPALTDTKREPPTQEPETSGWAIASLVLGMMSFACFCFTGVPAIVCGHSARKEIRRAKGQVTGSGLATAGLILGYLMCSVSLLGIIAYIAYSAKDSVQAQVQESDAARDAKAIHMSLLVYASDNKGKYPADLETLVAEGILTSDQPLRTEVKGWVGKPGWKYYGTGLGPADHMSKILLETRSRDLEGRGIQVTNDGHVELVLIDDGPLK